LDSGIRKDKVVEDIATNSADIRNIYSEIARILAVLEGERGKKDKRMSYIYKQFADHDKRLGEINNRWNKILGAFAFFLLVIELSRFYT